MLAADSGALRTVAVEEGENVKAHVVEANTRRKFQESFET